MSVTGTVCGHTGAKRSAKRVVFHVDGVTGGMNLLDGCKISLTWYISLSVALLFTKWNERININMIELWGTLNISCNTFYISQCANKFMCARGMHKIKSQQQQLLLLCEMENLNFAPRCVINLCPLIKKKMNNCKCKFMVIILTLNFPMVALLDGFILSERKERQMKKI